MTPGVCDVGLDGAGEGQLGAGLLHLCLVKQMEHMCEWTCHNAAWLSLLRVEALQVRAICVLPTTELAGPT
jgi:hypothetical protein